MVIAIFAVMAVMLAGCTAPLSQGSILGGPVYSPLAGRWINNITVNLTPTAGAMILNPNLTWPSSFGPPLGFMQIVISVTNDTAGQAITGALSIRRNLSACASPAPMPPDEILNSGTNLTPNVSYVFITPMIRCEELNLKYSGGGNGKIQKLVIQDLYDADYASIKT